jgi:hypothetical protein
MFLGHLLAFDDYKIFGYYSNTHIKVIVVCEMASSAAGVKDTVLALSRAYVDAASNPFQETGYPLQPTTARRFASSVQQIVMKFNSSSMAGGSSPSVRAGK